MAASSPAALLRRAVRLLVPLSVLLSTYLYLYPVFGQCAFPLPTSGPHRPPAGNGSAFAGFVETLKLHLVPGYDGPSTRPLSDSPLAPFRLLALGDPQLEGDTSIPNAYSNSSFPHLVSAFELATFQTRRRPGADTEDDGADAQDGAVEGDDDAPPDPEALLERVRLILHDLVDFWFLDLPLAVASARKRLDLFGNDYYLAHIYRTMHWWTVPTHVAVLGDLLGSQWVDDDEFAWRAHRYWKRVVRGAERVPDDAAAGQLGAPPRTDADQDAWTRRVINVAGNHDIGYAGDITEERLARFERQFGRANYALRFALPLDRLSPAAAAKVQDAAATDKGAASACPDCRPPELRIVNLNDMNLDTPAADTTLQDQTYAFINDVINTAAPVEAQGHFTVLLTHIPLYKPAGLCVDAPFFAFHDDDGTLREQNQLSEDASRGFLQGILGMHGDAGAPAAGKGRRGVILNGHDHEGCDSYHFVNQTQAAPVAADGTPGDRRWETARYAAAQADALVGRAGHPGVREITVRSMMGDFGGNAGLLSAWFDEDTWSWQFAYATCALGRPHLWWAVHVVDLLAVGACAAYGVVVAAAAVSGKRAAGTKTPAKAAVPGLKREKA